VGVGFTIWVLALLSIVIFIGVGNTQQISLKCTIPGASLASAEVLLTVIQIGYRQKTDRQRCL
jgi:hypothetical protein